MDHMTRRVLFVTWDGPAQNYMQSLFFPTFARAQREGGLKMGVLQFTWGDAAHIASIAESARAHDLLYTRHDVLRRPLKLAIPAMILYGAQRILKLVDEQGWDTLMPRSIIPAAMCLLALKQRPDLRLVYDADGFMADERVDFAGWSPNGVTYRLFRDWEAQAVRRAEAVMTRSHDAKQILQARAGAGYDADKIHVIPNGKDAEAFSPLDPTQRAAVREELGISPEAPLLVYAGSLGPQYHPEAMLALFDILHRRDPSARLLVLSRMREVIEALLPTLSPEARQGVILHQCTAAEVSRYLAASDLGLSLREPSFSQRGVCPIKVAEYLLCGLPVVMLRGVGDLDRRFADLPALYVLDDLSHASLEQVADWLEQGRGEHAARWRALAREAGEREFSLDHVAASLHAMVMGQPDLDAKERA